MDVKTTSATIIGTKDAFRFRDRDTHAKEPRKPGYVSIAEKAAMNAGDISADDLSKFPVIAFGQSRNYFEKTVRIAGLEFTYRAVSEGPEKMTQDDFASLVDRLSDRLFSNAYS